MSDIQAQPDGNVMVFADLFPPAFRGGGAIRSLDALVSAGQPGYVMHVLTTNADLGDRTPLPVEPNTWLPYRAARVMYLNVRSPRSLVLAIREVRRIKPDLYYLNSFFSPMFTILPLLLIRWRLLPHADTLLAPRGELCRGALAIKQAKKRLYLKLFTLGRDSRSITWHAASDREREDIERALGWPARVVVWERDTLLPLVPMKPSIRDEMNAPLRLVFVSRIVANKGLTTLLSALRSVREPVELDIYGPREDAKYWSRCVTFIDELPPNIAVRYRGVIVPKEVVQTFGQYDLFAFPTASENFGHVIAEALAGSCPVAIADCTPWTDVIRNGGGVVLSGRDPSEWARAIAVQARLGPAERRERRQAAGQAYAKWRNRPRGADLFELATGSQRRRASSGTPLDGQELGVRKAPVLEHEEYG